ncbi:hypothetical protein [Hyphomicrobium facile]|uniref:Uncharacterized protein n=1 Tax=Hyphomicrobium facile TaxID=51670 RepID=A0A1I7N074_9HYPH|nr:hypothetical protein [Hyphomicrobium facile]SFV28080.1 hypothetical protein SAMN04488557_0921 [Hyphomicrobium facile]
MNRIFPAIALAAGVTITAMSTAYAYEYNSHIRTDRNDIRRDSAAIARDERHIDEERQELSDARRHARWAWLHGEIWAAHDARENVREEAVELRGAEQKLNRDVTDIRHDREDLSEDHRSRHWWWN